MKEILTPDFRKAVTDYFYLLERNYPEKTISKMVGDRYGLTKVQRVIIYRGIFTSGKTKLRMERMKLLPDRATGIHIDTYNVLFTIGNYLKGRPVFKGNDNILRDAGEFFGKIVDKTTLDRSIDLLISYFNTKKITGPVFLIDQPVTHSSEIAEKINNAISQTDITFKIDLIKSPDKYLTELDNALIATSDSEIIDNSGNGFCDLAYEVLKHNFYPDFLKLSALL